MTILSTTPPAVRPRFAVPRYASWQDAMKDAVRDPAELCRLLDLPTEIVDGRPSGGATVSAVRAARVRGPHAAGRSDRSAAATSAAARRRTGRRARVRRRSGGRCGGDAAAGLAAEVSRPRAAGHDRHVCGPLPLLLPPALSVRRDAALARRLAAGARRNRGRRRRFTK